MWVITAAGLVAEQLDTIVVTQEINPVVRGRQNCVEESLACLLLQHQLDRRPMGYVPQPEAWGYEADAGGIDGTVLDAVPSDFDDDIPPF